MLTPRQTVTLENWSEKVSGTFFSARATVSGKVLALLQLGEDVAGAGAVALAHSRCSACMAFSIANATGTLLIVAVCGIGGAPSCGPHRRRGVPPPAHDARPRT